MKGGLLTCQTLGSEPSLSAPTLETLYLGLVPLYEKHPWSGSSMTMSAPLKSG